MLALSRVRVPFRFQEKGRSKSHLNHLVYNSKDEYREFEKLIQEDLKEVNNRMEEEEIDAAETIKEAESVDQRAYSEKVESLKKKKLELKAAGAAKRRRVSEVLKKEPSHNESSSDSETDENFAVDWRAQHL